MPPPGWKGWPDGKQFALVLTHDVETERGVERCRMIMDIEERLGFRSCFYFVPKRYDVPSGLREEMARRGFEVGVHGLYHDLSLFRSEKEFKRQAMEINRYLEEWGAVGFRAPYMIHNLEWIRECLNIEYDASTFDTNPFEPVPHGVGTIFPFMVDGPGGRACVELPSTLEQDHNLFVMLGEKSSDIWRKKLEWISSHGGLALLDAHPDYMQSGARLMSDEYPLRLYQEFLEHVRTRHTCRYWHAAPREVAQHVWNVNNKNGHTAPFGENAKSKRSRTPCQAKTNERDQDVRMGSGQPVENVAMLVFSHYPSDPRVRRAAEAMLETGRSVDIICLRGKGQSATEIVRGVNVIRLPLMQKRASKYRYLFEYGFFWLMAFFSLSLRHCRKKYVLVHVHNMPDVLVFCALLPKLTGAKLILDLHDPMPEVFMAKYNVGLNHLLPRVLLWFERAALRFVDAGITPNIAFRKLFIGRSCEAGKMHIVMNSPQEFLFNSAPVSGDTRVPKASTEFVVMYHGTIVERHGLDTAVEAVAMLRSRMPELRFHVYGSGDAFVESFIKLVEARGVGDVVTYHGYTPLEEIAAAIRGIDLGVIPNKHSAFTDLNFPTRIFEYLASGKPVIAPRTAGILDYFGEDNMFFFEPGNAESLASSIQRVATESGLRERVLAAGMLVSSKHCWTAEKRAYHALIESVLSRGRK